MCVSYKIGYIWGRRKGGEGTGGLRGSEKGQTKEGSRGAGWLRVGCEYTSLCLGQWLLGSVSLIMFKVYTQNKPEACKYTG